ncbi:MAG: hypothetical protein ACPG32_08445 [Akkermansiaceae bacterium]
MNNTVITYTGYLLIAIPLTIWVARTLHKNGRIFLLRSLKGDEALADSVNHLLVVGFYLINIGFVSLYLKMDGEVMNTSGIFEALSGKLGVVMLILGGMHFFNIWLFSRLGKDKTIAPTPSTPPAYAGWKKAVDAATTKP